MKIDCVIPTRGDRKDFVDFVVKQMENQTLPIDEIDVVDHPPANSKVDLASRFRIGIERRLAAGADVVFFIEDDDFYRHEYIASMMQMWNASGRPALFGLDVTVYYHLNLRMSGHHTHKGRASMYSSMVTKDFDMSRWPKDPERFVDLKIWKQAKSKKAVSPMETICLGIKHGVGKCGGSMHDPKKFLRVFSQKGVPDPGLEYLQTTTGPGFWFYKSIINQSKRITGRRIYRCNY